jgi:small subunit ribosomal protein S29
MYDSRTRTYLQPTFCYQTLQRFLTVNAHALDSLQTQRELVLENDRVIAPNTPLGELVDIGLKEQALAPTILSLLLEELGAQQQLRVPPN